MRCRRRTRNGFVFGRCRELKPTHNCCIPPLEREPVRPSRFDLPGLDDIATQDAARLLSDALHLSMRRGAGPFRSAGRLAFEPRAYQLVPLLMALRLPTVRLLIADDVGIGKTIEAGLILRELVDRGEVDRFSVLCPPHLVEQWTGELKSKFDLDAVAVTASSAADWNAASPSPRRFSTPTPSPSSASTTSRATGGATALRARVPALSWSMRRMPA